MTRKRPPVRAAIWNDDGSVRFVYADELRVQKEEHKGKVAPRPIVEGQKLSADEILQHLVAAYFAHEHFHPHDPDVRIPFALLQAIGIAIGGKRAWRREQRAAIAERDRRWRNEASRMQKENPSLTIPDVAKILSKRERAHTPDVRGAGARNIRRAISKPKR